MGQTTLADRSVLITGGAGFIGNQLVEELSGANEVIVLDDCSTGCPERLPPDVQLLRRDISESDAFARTPSDIGIVYHLAANVSVDRSVAEPIWSHSVNVTGTLSALEFAKAHNARLVFASSAAVYGMPDNVPISEDAPPEPCSPYGAEKLAAEHYVRLYNQLYDIETVGLRLFNVYGPGQPPNASAGVITRFMKDAIDDQPLTIHGDGEQTRDFVHVNDVVDACLAAGTTAYTGEMFNIGTGYETSVNELADKILDAADSTAGVVRDTPRSGDIARSCADIEKAQNKLGYAPTVEITDGLNSLVEVA